MNITVLIANYNYGRYLSKAIESALNQTVKPSCICIVDDASTDNSWEIISQYCSNNQREEQVLQSPSGQKVLIRVGSIDDVDILGVLLPETSGPSVARNVGIQFTRPSTHFYQILDADDEMLPNKIEELLKPMENPAVGLTYANYYNVQEWTGVKILEVKEPYDSVRINNECIVHSGFLLRAEALDLVMEEGKAYDVTMRTCEDWELEIRLARVCMFYHVPMALTNVLVHNMNSTNSVKKEVWNRNWQYISHKHFGGN